jgi:hypothetical protein
LNADLSTEMVHLLRWLRRREGIFTVAEALACAADADAAEARDLLEGLLWSGYLTRDLL